MSPSPELLAACDNWLSIYLSERWSERAPYTNSLAEFVHSREQAARAELIEEIAMRQCEWCARKWGMERDMHVSPDLKVFHLCQAIEIRALADPVAVSPRECPECGQRLPYHNLINDFPCPRDPKQSSIYAPPREHVQKAEHVHTPDWNGPCCKCGWECDLLDWEHSNMPKECERQWKEHVKASQVAPK